METLLNGIAGRRASHADASATFTALLLAVLPATGQSNTPFTATSWLTGVPVPGLLCTNALGQVSLKGNVHVLKVQTDDARVAGRLQAMPDVAFQADGTRVFSGTAYNEVGTWNATGTNFTRIGGAWDLRYRGVTQADGSIQYNMAGYGIGGTIDGLRIELTATRAAGPTFDPTIPYLASGTIKPAPVNTRDVIDNFDDDISTNWNPWSSNNRGTIAESNGQFTVWGHWPGISGDMRNTWSKGWRPTIWRIDDGQTLEFRVDLVGMDASTTYAVLEPTSHALGRTYELTMGQDFVAIGKWTTASSAYVLLSVEKAATKSSNVVMSLALTRVRTNLVLTARLLDKDNHDAVLYQRAVVDTPESDPSLTAEAVHALTGIQGTQFNPDVRQAPLMAGDWLNLKIAQCNYDGQQPPAKATFDNLEMRTYEAPQVGIERAVQLTWPAPTQMNYVVEGGPTVQGPWLPVQDPARPGLQQMTVPANDAVRFFRLQQAP